MGYAFISYSSQNQQMADSFKSLFNQNDIATWMAPGDIPFGSTYTSTINSAIKGASCFVLLLSESAQGSKWVLRETERAVSTGKTIFPVLLDDVPMNDDFEFMLSTSQAIAVRKINTNDETIQRLLRAVRAFTNEGTNKERVPRFNSGDLSTDKGSDIGDAASCACETREGPAEERMAGNHAPLTKYYDACKIYIASDEGSICFASSIVKSFDEESYLDFSGELKHALTAQLEELLSCIYQINQEMLSIDYISAEDKVRLIPSSELHWNPWSVDANYKIQFRVRHFEHDGDLLYDTIHFELGNDLNVSFFQNGHYIHKASDQVIPFERLGIAQEEAIKSATKLINLCYPKKQIRVQKKFVPKIYSDCSGGYHLKFLLD